MKQVATLAELETILASSGDAIVCIDFTAAWCAPCQLIAPRFEFFSAEMPNVVFLKVDVDENEVGFEVHHSPQISKCYRTFSTKFEVKKEHFSKFTT